MPFLVRFYDIQTISFPWGDSCLVKYFTKIPRLVSKLQNITFLFNIVNETYAASCTPFVSNALSKGGLMHPQDA